MGITWVEAAVAAVYFSVMARYLGPARYGHWAYGIAAYVLVIGLVGFGFDQLIILRLAGDKRGAAGFVGLTLTLRLALLGFGGAGLVAYALAVEPDPVSRLILLLLIPALFGRGMALWARVCFLAYERVADYAWVVTVLRAGEAGCGIAYLVSGGGLLGIVGLHALFWSGEALFGLWRVRTRLAAYKLRFDWRSTLELLAQGTILGLAAAAYTWLVSGPIMLLRLSGVAMAQLGQFGIVSSLTMILVASANSFFAAALPVLSRSAQRAAPRMAAYGRLTTLAVAAATVAAAGVGWALGPSVAVWALGPPYAVAGSLLAPFLLIGGTILMPAGYNQMLLLAGRRWPGALANLLAGLWLAAALPQAAAVWSLDGAVLATAIAWIIRAAMLIAIGERCAGL